MEKKELLAGYVAPQVEIIEVAVEKGFASSGDDPYATGEAGNWETGNF